MHFSVSVICCTWLGYSNVKLITVCIKNWGLRSDRHGRKQLELELKLARVNKHDKSGGSLDMLFGQLEANR